jgi:hypothetical protein
MRGWLHRCLVRLAAWVAPVCVLIAPLAAQTDTVRTIGADTVHRVGDSLVYGKPVTTVITTRQFLVDSVRVAPVVARGVPFGPYSAPDPLPAPFNAWTGSTSPSTIISAISKARVVKQTIVPALPCGPHKTTNLGRCLKLVNGVATFDMALYRTAMQAYNTPAIKAAIAAGRADGTIVGSNVMDEPHVSGSGDGNTWGPSGTMTKARVDSLCQMHKDLGFVPGVAHQWGAFEPTKRYKVCGFVINQYSYRAGSLTAWRDGALAMGVRDGHGTMFSFNPINGGTQDKTGVWDCPGTLKGQSSPNCAMTPAQIIEVATTLGKATCGAQVFWRYDAILNNEPTRKAAYQSAANTLKALPTPKKCQRTPPVATGTDSVAQVVLRAIPLVPGGPFALRVNAAPTDSQRVQYCAFAVLKDGRKVKMRNSWNSPVCEEAYQSWLVERTS